MLKEIEKRILTSLIIIPITFFFIYKGSVFFILFLIITFFLSSYEWVKLNKKNELIKSFGIIFLILSFYFAYLLRLEQGFKIFLFIILISILTDIGGYIFGKTFKGPKLTKISPKKTYAGVFGGYFLSIIFTNILTNYSELFTNQNLHFGKDEFIFVLIISTVSQVGDIIISFFKRLSKIKDTGKLIPGHGGILDRIDGMIFAFPFYYILSLIFN
jgi:phosphatidate cytidylyltransferase